MGAALLGAGARAGGSAARANGFIKRYHGSAKAKCVTPPAWGEESKELTAMLLPCSTKLLKKFGGLQRVPMKQFPKDAMENASNGGTSK